MVNEVNNCVESTKRRKVSRAVVTGDTALVMAEVGEGEHGVVKA